MGVCNVPTEEILKDISDTEFEIETVKEEQIQDCQKRGAIGYVENSNGNRQADCIFRF